MSLAERRHFIRCMQYKWIGSRTDKVTSDWDAFARHFILGEHRTCWWWQDGARRTDARRSPGCSSPSPPGRRPRRAWRQLGYPRHPWARCRHRRPTATGRKLHWWCRARCGCDAAADGPAERAAPTRQRPPRGGWAAHRHRRQRWAERIRAQQGYPWNKKSILVLTKTKIPSFNICLHMKFM